MYLGDERPAGIVILLVLFALEAAAWFALAGLTLLVAFPECGCSIVPWSWRIVLFGLISVALLCVGLLYVDTARDLWGMERSAWRAAIALSAFAFASGPLALTLASPFRFYAPLGVPVGLICLVILFHRSVAPRFGYNPSHARERVSGGSPPKTQDGLAQARSAVPLDEAEYRAALAGPSALCAGCGAPLDAADAFCGKCGSKAA